MNLLNLFFNKVLAERAADWQVGFQIPASPVMEGIVYFHHDIFYILVMIVFFTFFLILRCLMRFGYTDLSKEAFERKKEKAIFMSSEKYGDRSLYSFSHAPMLEIIWTLIPAAILVLISIPSYSLIYSIDEMINPLWTVKVVGHQWYWTYEDLDINYLINDLESLNYLNFDVQELEFLEKKINYANELNNNIQEQEYLKYLINDADKDFNLFTNKEELNNLTSFKSSNEDIANFEWNSQTRKEFESLYKQSLERRLQEQKVEAVEDSKEESMNSNNLNDLVDQLVEGESQSSEFDGNIIDKVSDVLKGDDIFLSYDSYMVPTEDVEVSWKRLLKVDNELFVPIETNVRFLITSGDVIHSWAVPALGIKLDACPGRLNQTSVFIKRASVFYGQCSEICGVNHGFMPIAVKSIDSLGEGTNLGEYRTKLVEGLLSYFEKEKCL